MSHARARPWRAANSSYLTLLCRATIVATRRSIPRVDRCPGTSWGYLGGTYGYMYGAVQAANVSEEAQAPHRQRPRSRSKARGVLLAADKFRRLGNIDS